MVFCRRHAEARELDRGRLGKYCCTEAACLALALACVSSAGGRASLGCRAKTKQGHCTNFCSTATSVRATIPPWLCPAWSSLSLPSHAPPGSLAMKTLTSVLALAGLAASAMAQDFSGIDAVINGAIARKVTPGAVAAFAIGDRLVYSRAYGSFTYGDKAPVTGSNPETQVDTKYDLASLTKVTTTTSCIATFYQVRRPAALHLPCHASHALRGPPATPERRAAAGHTPGEPIPARISLCQQRQVRHHCGELLAAQCGVSP